MDVRRWRVEGRVQGVGFRWFVRERARRLGLAGWVTNLGDGAVEVAAGGDVTSLDTLEVALRQGPEGAQVTRLVTLDGPPGSDLPNPFTILR